LQTTLLATQPEVLTDFLPNHYLNNRAFGGCASLYLTR